jgi:hypothetical protein
MMNDGATEFLNVDLDVFATFDLSVLVSALEPAATPLYCGGPEDGYRASLEVDFQPDDPEQAIRAFIALIDGLPAETRALWDGASRRDFSIGVEVGTAAPALELTLPPALLRSVVGVGATVTLVVYAADRQNEREVAPIRSSGDREEPETRFINVDLGVWHTVNLAEFVRSMETGTASLYSGPVETGYLATFQLLPQPKDPEEAIRRFVGLTDRLPQNARVPLDGALRRDFSIGVQGGVTPHSLEWALSTEALRLATALDASVTFVTYPVVTPP